MVIIFLHFIDLVYALVDFSYVEIPLQSWDKSYMVMVDNLFSYAAEFGLLRIFWSTVCTQKMLRKK